MDCILNGVSLQACNSEVNILFVDDYKEVFFDVYSLNIAGKPFIGELVENTVKGPVVKVKSIKIGDVSYNDASFLIVNGTPDVRVHINEKHLGSGEIDVYVSPTPDLIVETLKSDNITLPVKSIDTSVNLSAQLEINKLKEQAIANIQKEKDNLQLLKEQVESSNAEISQKLEEYKSSLLEHFYSVVDDNKNTFTVVAEKRFEEILEALKEENNKTAVDLSEKIIEQSVSELTSFFDNQKNEIVSTLLSKSIKEIQDLAAVSEAKLTNLSNDNLKESKLLITENLDKVSDLVKKQISLIEEKIEATYSSNKTQLLKEYYEILDKAKNDLNSEYKETVIKILDNVEKEKLSLNEEFKRLQTYNEENITKNTEFISLKVSELVDELNAAKNNFKNKLETELTESVNKIADSIQNANKTLENIASINEENISKNTLLVIDKVNELSKTIDQGKDNFKSAIDEAKEDFKRQIEVELKDIIVKTSSDVSDTILNKREFIEEVYQKFLQENSPKIDSAIEELFSETAKHTFLEKVDITKSKKVSSSFQQMFDTQWRGKQTELIRQMKKVVMDFYYSFGSGGGSGNVTIVQSTTGGGGGGPTETPYLVFSTNTLTGPSAVLDYFALSAFNTAKYTIQALSGNEVYASEILVLGNSVVGKYTEYAVLHTTLNPYIGYAANSTGTYLQLIVKAETDLTGISFKGLRLDPLLQ